MGRARFVDINGRVRRAPSTSTGGRRGGGRGEREAAGGRESEKSEINW